MTGWLLDTNILTALRRPRPQRAAQPLEQLCIIAVTFAETRFGIEVVGDAASAPNSTTG